MLGNDELFRMVHADCIEHMATMEPESMDFSCFSPPFPSVYAYSADAADIGNSEDLGREGKLHLSFFYRQLARVIKPGRVIMVHVAQIPRMKRSGLVGLHDFRGLNIRLGERAGLVFEYDWMVRKGPQSQAIRSKSRELQFAGLEKDRAKCRGALQDYLLKFRTVGENTVEVDSPEVSRNDWIELAEGCWDDINETDTLNVRGTKGPDDTRHVCPLQLGVISRLVKLFTNPGEIVFSPFVGIGSELYSALLLGRRGYGIELKPEYHATAIANCERAIVLAKEKQQTLFDQIESRQEALEAV